ncbi:MAG: vtpJ-therm [Deltaproteobacteria bacterium]|nr:MAG: vtpJ-therm [Deltaproteobacteria bacterium]
MRYAPLILLLACSAPFAELVDNGATEHLGTITPDSEVEADGVTDVTFDPADGPMCLHGAPYRMALREGPAQGPLHIAMQGGGACWDDACTAFDTPGDGGVPGGGILNPNLTLNPLRDWDVGWIPYCDGSLFAGHADHDDDGDGEVDRIHRGLVNTSAALDVIHDRWPDPERIVISGISGGAYGSLIAVVLVRELYPDVPIDIVADAGLGLARPDEPEFIEDLLDQWNIQRLIPESCEDCTADGHLTAYVAWLLRRDRNLRIFQLTSRGDFIIGTLFLDLDFEDYEGAVLGHTAAVEESWPQRYGSYVFNGNKHTSVAVDSTVEFSGEAAGLPIDASSDTLDRVLGSFDQTEIGGQLVADWVTAALLGDEPVESRLSAE